MYRLCTGHGPASRSVPGVGVNRYRWSAEGSQVLWSEVYTVQHANFKDKYGQNYYLIRLVGGISHCTFCI